MREMCGEVLGAKRLACVWLVYGQEHDVPAPNVKGLWV